MAGLSKSRLERMHRVLSEYVERGDLPGLVALVGRDDDVHVETMGAMGFGPSAPMRRDAIFRIASLTKPITAAAADERHYARHAPALNMRGHDLMHAGKPRFRQSFCAHRTPP